MRAFRLVVGLVVSAVAAVLAALGVAVAAVITGQAPLGLAGESTSKQPWVDPATFGVGLAVFVVGAVLSVRWSRRDNAPFGP